jgi:hypothetical protein
MNNCKLQTTKSQLQNKSKIPNPKNLKVGILWLGFILMFEVGILMFGPSAAYAQTTFDPLSIGVGARALGMGKAYAAVAEEGDTIFTNPAGLGEIDSFYFMSMSGSLLEDVNYTVLSGVYPLGERSAWGIGYVAANVSGIEMRNTYGTLLATSTFSNSVLLASYGRKLTDKLSLGANLKYYSQEGSDNTSGNGTGFNLDVGFLQKGLGWLSLGVVAKNILSSSPVSYKNGSQDELPRSLKVGTRMYLMGEGFEAATLGDIEVFASVDADLNLQGSTPTTIHAGLELSPVPSLTLRTGIDQDARSGSIQSNATYGLSVKFAGIGFHYAYHAYTEFSRNATSFFSLSFDDRGWPFEGLPDIFMGSTNEEIS